MTTPNNGQKEKNWGLKYTEGMIKGTRNRFVTQSETMVTKYEWERNGDRETK